MMTVAMLDSLIVSRPLSDVLAMVCDMGGVEGDHGVVVDVEAGMGSVEGGMESPSEHRAVSAVATVPASAVRVTAAPPSARTVPASR